MSSKRSTDAKSSNSVLELFGSQSRQFVELGRELSLDDLVKGMIKLSEELGTEGRNRIIQAFAEHNRIAELEDQLRDGDRFRRSGFDFTRPNAKSSNYSVKLYWWDREKTQRQYISTIPFKPGQVMRMTHRSTGEERVMLCEGLYTDRSLFELVPAIKQYRQMEVQNRRTRKQTKQQDSIELNPLPPDLGIQLRLKQILPTQQFIVLSYPRCFRAELNEDEWQFEGLSEREVKALENNSPVKTVSLSSDETEIAQQSARSRLAHTTLNEPSTSTATQFPVDLPRQKSPARVSAAKPSQGRRSEVKNQQQANTQEVPKARSTSQTPINPVPTFEALALLSQLTDFPLQVIETASNVVLQNAQKQPLVTFNAATQQLTSHYADAELIQLMQKLVSTTFRRSDATEEQHQAATRLRVRLQGANHQKSDELLYYLMGTPSKRRKLAFDDRSRTSPGAVRS
ncbi:hypothetical protein ACQ4M3_05565 [Leptolyngbya sp. AN03gr2]|uniref:hypothetical protein n=1 Tax=unclassified Leptolyngbya TaxID=2650499 RepID=UPI003D3205C7